MSDELIVALTTTLSYNDLILNQLSNTDHGKSYI